MLEYINDSAQPQARFAFKSLTFESPSFLSSMKALLEAYNDMKKKVEQIDVRTTIGSSISLPDNWDMDYPADNDYFQLVPVSFFHIKNLSRASLPVILYSSWRSNIKHVT